MHENDAGKFQNQPLKFDIPSQYECGSWPPVEYDVILIEFGRIVFNWNNIERLITQMLYHLSDGGAKSIILTAHMGNTAIADALRTIANTYLSDPQKENILHAITLFERIREYRNYIVHAFNGIKSTHSNSDYTSSGTLYAAMQTFVARGNFIIKELDLSQDDLVEISRLVRNASQYFTLMHGHIVHSHFQHRHTEPPPPLPDKFPLPERLTTSFRRPTIEIPQPQSSGG